MITKKILGIVIVGYIGFSFFALRSYAAFPKKLLTLPHYFFQHTCAFPAFGNARCHAQVVVNKDGKPSATPSIPLGAYGPLQFHTAYQLPCTPGGSVSGTCSTPPVFSKIIGIVDAYQDPTLENDLAVYNTAYNLPSCTVANGCLSIVNQNGGTSLPQVDSGWALEESLDTQIAHAMCQTCKIVVVETNSSSLSDLATGVATAARLGAQAISNSYGGSEFYGELVYDNYYNHPGVAVTVSSGDSGYGTEYPATSPDVVAVGGTTLRLYSDNSYAGETAWSSTGSGCSFYEPANAWQTGLPNWGAMYCFQKRGVADISADADPNTGAAVYDTTPYYGQSG